MKTLDILGAALLALSLINVVLIVAVAVNPTAPVFVAAAVCGIATVGVWLVGTILSRRVQ